LHESVLPQELFDRVQAILDGRMPTSAPKRKVNPPVPFNRFIRCDSCDPPLTGGFCTGRAKTYPYYYWCLNLNCRAVKLRGEQMEPEFLDLLRRLRPEPGISRTFRRLQRRFGRPSRVILEEEAKRLEARL
jgi:hypothetical protein